MKNSETIAKRLMQIFKVKGNFKISRENLRRIAGRDQLRDALINEIWDNLYDAEIFMANLDSEFVFVRINTLTKNPEISWEDSKEILRRKVKK